MRWTVLSGAAFGGALTASLVVGAIQFERAKVERPAEVRTAEEMPSKPTEAPAVQDEVPAARTPPREAPEPEPDTESKRTAASTVPVRRPGRSARPERKRSAIVPAPPSFDILRVTPEGEMLIAGRAARLETVQVIANGLPIGTVEAGDTGDFVYTSETVPPGEYTVRLVALDRPEVVSEETAIVGIPEAGEAPIALLTAPDEPSRVVSRAVDPSSVLAAPAGSKAEITAAPSVRPAVAPDLRIEAVELEGDRIYIAGGARRSTTVRIYLNREYVGEAKATAERRFLLETTRALPEGRHTVRADLIEEGEVIARARVPLVHEREPVPPTVARDPEPAAADAAEQLPPAAAPSRPIDDITAEPLRTGSAVIIRWGDSLWRISRRTYGQGIRYSTIYAANRDQIADPDRIYPGQVFKLPGSGDTATR